MERWGILAGVDFSAICKNCQSDFCVDSAKSKKIYSKLLYNSTILNNKFYFRNPYVC